MRLRVPDIMLLFLLLAPLPAAAAVSGHLAWRFADFQADGPGIDVEAASFSQQYAVEYVNSGNLNGGRGGTYTYGLGAEFTGLNNSINGTDDALSTFKPLYTGQLLLAPGGLPFRLKLYTGDSHITTLLYDSNFALANAMFVPGIATDFSNGKHRRTGATLALGIKNGSYLGSYRDVLSKWPRLLMDYREIEVESFRSKQPQNYRQRELAFVSLNKKDNWFHYRFSDYQDFTQLDRRGDYQTKRYILGTIDPNLERAWINMTNWVKVSVDGSFTQENQATISAAPTESYATNLFATTNRDSFRSSAFLNFNRKRGGDGVSRFLSVPITVSRVVDRNTSWALSTSYDGRLDPREDEEIYFLGLRVDAWRSRRYSLTPEAKVEFMDSIDKAGSAMEVGLRLASSRARQGQSDNQLTYALRRFVGEDHARDVDYLEQQLTMSHARSLAHWQFSVSEDLQVGSGTVASNFGRRIVARTANAQVFGGGQQSDRKGTTIHTISNLSAEHSGRYVSNRVGFVLDYLSTNDDGNLQWGVTHYLTSNKRRNLDYSMTNEIISGEGQTFTTGSVAAGQLGSVSRSHIQRTFSHISKIKYTPTRSLTGGVSFNLKSQINGSRSLHYLVRQDCLYTHFRVNGVIRTLFTLEEELSYEQSSDGGESQSLSELMLVAGYYPTRHIQLGATGRYRSSEGGSWKEDSFTTSLSAALIYPQFSMRLVYNQGANSERQEQGWQLAIDKSF